MIKISLTDFIDFVSKAGSTKYSKVKQIAKRKDYQPAFDFWKPLREAIIKLHKEGNNKKELDNVMEDLTDKKKEKRYLILIKAYKSFLGRKKINWFDPPKKKYWKYKELNVILNPELGLEINNKFFVVKLYFKSEKLSQKKADLILLLMNKHLKKGKYKDVNFAILDIERKKLFDKTNLKNEQFSLLEGEALSFLTIWRSIKK